MRSADSTSWSTASESSTSTKGVADLDADNLAAAFDEMFRTNVLSHLQSVKAAVPALRNGTEPSIVLTESASSYYPGRGGVLYVSSKFAVRGLVASLAHELAPQIRVNGVAPGGTVNTDLRGLTSLGLNETPPRRQSQPGTRHRRTHAVERRAVRSRSRVVVRVLGLRPVSRHHR